MRRITFLSIFIVYISVTFIGCDTVDNSNAVDTDQEWLIPENEIFDGGPGKDGITALSSPSFTEINNISYLNDDDLVLIVSIGNEIRIYPHPILD